ncbi:MAG: CAP domain-containing protein [Crenarchaeota archaeon]|nr:MAG: CAP domain-containing protein [Thermoproteota archaeon]
MKKLIYALTMASILVIGGCSSWTEKWGNVPMIGVIETDLLNLHNAARNEPLVLDEACKKAAQDQANWMAKHNMLVHDRPLSYKDKRVSDRLQKKWTVIGENIAQGQETPKGVFGAWMNSRGHRSNIKNYRFKYVGFGVATSSSGYKYWCVVFSD